MKADNDQNARKLLAGSQVFAANSREGFAAEYPTLNEIPADEWISLMTIAGTGTALLSVAAGHSVERQKELTSIVIESITAWDKDAVQELADFINFITTGTNDSEDVPDLIGAWVLRSRKMAPSEHTAAHVIGLMLMNTFAPWWEQ